MFFLGMVKKKVHSAALPEKRNLEVKLGMQEYFCVFAILVPTVSCLETSWFKKSVESEEDISQGLTF